MKRTTLLQAATFAVVAGAAAASPAALATYRCDNPTAPFDQRACAKAAQGPDVLRRYVERTQTIYGLYFFDYVKENVRVASTVEPTRTAAASGPTAP